MPFPMETWICAVGRTPHPDPTTVCPEGRTSGSSQPYRASSRSGAAHPPELPQLDPGNPSLETRRGKECKKEGETELSLLPSFAHAGMPALGDVPGTAAALLSPHHRKPSQYTMEKRSPKNFYCYQQ